MSACGAIGASDPGLGLGFIKEDECEVTETDVVGNGDKTTESTVTKNDVETSCSKCN